MIHWVLYNRDRSRRKTS